MVSVPVCVGPPYYSMSTAPSLLVAAWCTCCTSCIDGGGNTMVPGTRVSRACCARVSKLTKTLR
eukprot:1740430-Amphidinium_carterae.1